MDAKWWPVIVIPCIGLTLVIVGIKFMTDQAEDAGRKRVLGAAAVAAGIVCMVVAGLVGAFMSV